MMLVDILNLSDGTLLFGIGDNSFNIYLLLNLSIDTLSGLSFGISFGVQFNAWPGSQFIGSFTTWFNMWPGT